MTAPSEPTVVPLREPYRPNEHIGPEERALGLSIRWDNRMTQLRRDLYDVWRAEFQAAARKGRMDAAKDLERAGMAAAAQFLRGEPEPGDGA